VNRVFRVAALAGMVLLGIAAAPKKTVGWNYVVALTPGGGHLLGNPAAKVKLVEYVSYTCPHCAHFQIEADDTLRLGYIASGKVSAEVRHMLRDPIDFTVAMLTNCGPKEKFFLNHSMLMRRQSTWIQPMATATAAQRQRWTNPDMGIRNRAIASDFKLYQIMATRGYDRQSLERCLIDRTVAERLVAQTKAASAAGVNATPTFAINGKLLDGTSDWAGLRPKLDESLK
jgi:protein-disulfide isomerase